MALCRHAGPCVAHRRSRVAAATITKHGQLFAETDLQAVQPGMSQDQVRAALGTPATTAVVGDGRAYYYISSTDTQEVVLPADGAEPSGRRRLLQQGGTVDKRRELWLEGRQGVRLHQPHDAGARRQGRRNSEAALPQPRKAAALRRRQRL